MLLDTVKELCELSAPSGLEDSVREYIRERAKPYADEMREDSIGNLMIFRRGRRSGTKTVMLSAHMDEVGVICKGYTEDGCVKFGFVGAVDRRTVIGRRIIFEGDVRGVVGIKAVHLTTREERQTMPKADALYIDIGCTDKNEAKKKVPLGTYGVFDSKCVEFGDGMLKAKSIGGRTGCAVLLELMKGEPENDTWFAFTAQEQVGMRGAGCAAYNINPDICLVLDGCTAADLAGVDERKQICSLRGGAVIAFMDSRTIYDEGICRLLRDCADDESIPWQTMQSTGGCTDAGRIHLAREGVKTGLLALPVRCVNSPSEVAAAEDIDAVLRTARSFLNRIGEHDEI